MEYFLMKRPEKIQECECMGCGQCIENVDKTVPCAYKEYISKYREYPIDQQMEKINKNMSRMAIKIAKLEEKQ